MFGRDKDATSENLPKRKAKPPEPSQEKPKYPKGTVFYCKQCGEDESEEYSSLEELEAHKREAHRGSPVSPPADANITLLFRFVDGSTFEHECKESEAKKIFEDLDNITKDWLVLDDDGETHFNKSNIISVEVE